MPRNLRWKFIVIAAVVIGCVTGVVGIPTSMDDVAKAWNRNIRLGLDLKGGSHLALQVHVQDAFKTAADELMEVMRNRLAEGGIAYGAMDRNDPNSLETAASIQIDVKGIPAARAGDFSRIANEAGAGDWEVTGVSQTDYRLTMRKTAALRLQEDTLTQSVLTIERKVNGLGVAEASVQRRGGAGGRAEILVQLPGVDDPARVNAIIQTAAMLELVEVKDGPFSSREEILSQRGGVLPPNTRLVRGNASSAGASGEVWWLLARSPVVTGRDLRDARPQQTETGGWETAFVLKQDAAGRFERYTGANIGNRLAIVLDHSVLSAPRIEGKISDQGRIMGAASQQEASDLALNLRAGSLPAGLGILENRFVGPSLGADSIRRGVTAGITGLALVIGSMLLYYRGAGLNAVLALLLNTIITIAALSYIDATWTLPGIAGLVLSIGMAVDSNVLIFERIKEELKAGRAVYAAIATGFDRAFITIVDTHVTTVVASAFLFLFGSGPVRGFAVTLAIGLVANLFTAVFVSRAIFDLQLSRNPKLQALSIGWLGGGATARIYDFLGKRYPALALSALLIVVSIGSLVMQGGPKYGLDFKGGVLVAAKCEPRPSIEALRQVLSANIQGEISVQEDRSTGEFIIGTELSDEQSLESTREKVEQTLRSKYTSVDIRSANMVGPRAGAQMRQQALYATIGALGGMLAYIAFRFEMISGVAAVIATIHDVVITIGLFSLTGREINLNIIAALLTLIGYSMNDKIVVFDRVRENMAKRRSVPFLEMVNLSINQTLSRTMLTAGPTLLACLALYFLGGEVLNGIAFALFAGIIVGTWSSIFVASTLLVMWHGHRARKNTKVHA